MSDLTREEAISTLEMLRFPEPWEQKLSKRAEEALDIAISALSNEGEYIKKSDMEKILYSTNNAVRIGELFTELPTYSFPDSKSVINKVLEVIKSQRFKAYDWYASLAPTLGKSCQKDYEADMEIYDGVIEAVELYRDSISDNPDSAENKGEWIEHKTKNGTVVALTCPKCLKSPKNAVRSDFCPNCGADMRGK